MKKHVVGLAAVALAVPATAAAADPVSAVKADAAKLQADVSAAHGALIADAQKLAADATAAKGKSKADAKAAIETWRIDYNTRASAQLAQWGHAAAVCQDH